jgi:Ras-related protein Rab-39B
LNRIFALSSQERFRSITKSYYRNSVGVVLAYDINHHESFAHVPVWMQEAKKHIEPHKAVFVLVSHRNRLLQSIRASR